MSNNTDTDELELKLTNSCQQETRRSVVAHRLSKEVDRVHLRLKCQGVDIDSYLSELDALSPAAFPQSAYSWKLHLRSPPSVRPSPPEKPPPPSTVSEKLDVLLNPDQFRQPLVAACSSPRSVRVAPQAAEDEDASSSDSDADAPSPRASSSSPEASVVTARVRTLRGPKVALTFSSTELKALLEHGYQLQRDGAPLGGAAGKAVGLSGAAPPRPPYVSSAGVLAFAHGGTSVASLLRALPRTESLPTGTTVPPLPVVSSSAPPHRQGRDKEPGEEDDLFIGGFPPASRRRAVPPASNGFVLPVLQQRLKPRRVSCASPD